MYIFNLELLDRNSGSILSIKDAKPLNMRKK